jgi:hypothetical protein
VAGPSVIEVFSYVRGGEQAPAYQLGTAPLGCFGAVPSGKERSNLHEACVFPAGWVLLVLIEVGQPSK